MIGTGPLMLIAGKMAQAAIRAAKPAISARSVVVLDFRDVGWVVLMGSSVTGILNSVQVFWHATASTRCGGRMSHHRSDVVEHALEVLDRHGLADLSMRRLAADLGVQPSALYWHFANKQALLAAVADEVLRRGTATRPGRHVGRAGDGRGTRTCVTRCSPTATAPSWWPPRWPSVSVMADPVGPPGRAARRRPRVARVAATTVLHFVLGHVTDEQMNVQAAAPAPSTTSR